MKLLEPHPRNVCARSSAPQTRPSSKRHGSDEPKVMIREPGYTVTHTYAELLWAHCRLYLGLEESLQGAHRDFPQEAGHHHWSDPLLPRAINPMIAMTAVAWSSLFNNCFQKPAGASKTLPDEVKSAPLSFLRMILRSLEKISVSNSKGSSQGGQSGLASGSFAWSFVHTTSSAIREVELLNAVANARRHPPLQGK